VVEDQIQNFESSMVNLVDNRAKTLQILHPHRRHPLVKFLIFCQEHHPLHDRVKICHFVVRFFTFWSLQNRTFCSAIKQGFQSGPVPGTFTRLRSCIVPAEITEPPKISGGQNHKYDGRIQIEQLRHDQVDGIFPVLKITLP
jgi:hypothetical protein